ncbi:hypothetical protein WCWAEYFT_CDS0052 [Vibrio phage VB_VaC_TDDLMA]
MANRDKTQEFNDFDDVSIIAERVPASAHEAFSNIDEDLIAFRTSGSAGAPYLTQEQAAEFAKQLLNLCNVEYRI